MWLKVTGTHGWCVIGIRTRTYLRERRVLRRQLYKLPSFKKKPEGTSAPPSLDVVCCEDETGWEHPASPAPLVHASAHSGGPSLASALQPWLTEGSHRSALPFCFGFFFLFAQTGSGLAGLSLCTVGTSSAFLQTADNILSLDLHCDL